MKPNGKGEGCHIAIIAILVSVVVTLPLTGEANKKKQVFDIQKVANLEIYQIKFQTPKTPPMRNPLVGIYIYITFVQSHDHGIQVRLSY